jgi:nicotinate dehydrogenase subunit B
MTAAVHISRRDFLGTLGGGIVILFGLDVLAPSAAAERPGYPSDVNAYLAIGGNGRVTVFSSKIEMGQGVMTSLAQMAAEEVGVDLASIDMVMGDTEKCPWDAGTFGSLSTRMFGPALRAAAAKARAVLTTLAAAKLGVAADRVMIEHGIASVMGEPNQRVSFAELADGAKISESATFSIALVRARRLKL